MNLGAELAMHYVEAVTKLKNKQLHLQQQAKIDLEFEQIEIENEHKRVKLEQKRAELELQR